MENPVLRTRNSLGHWLLLGLLLTLSGCEDEVTWARLGMLYSSLSYGLALATVLGLAGRWSFRAPDMAKRVPVLAAPAVVLVGTALWMMATVPPGPRAELMRLLSPNLALIIIMFTAAPLMGILSLIWRLWFAIAPRRSIEGTAIIGSALFFLPGLLLVGGMLPTRQAQEQVIVAFVVACLYGVYPGPIVVMLLGFESWLARRRHDSASRLSTD